jgi:hypothetical protein
LRGIVVPEIQVHLHPDQKRARIAQIDQNLVHAEIGEIARLGRTESSQPDDRRNGGNLAGDLAATKGNQQGPTATSSSSRILVYSPSA